MAMPPGNGPRRLYRLNGVTGLDWFRYHFLTGRRFAMSMAKRFPAMDNSVPTFIELPNGTMFEIIRDAAGAVLSVEEVDG